MGFWHNLRELVNVAPHEAKDFTSGGWDGKQPDIWSNSSVLNSFVSSISSNRERIENSFEAYVGGAYKRNGPIFSCIAARQFVFSEAVFKFRTQDKDTGRPGELFSNLSLRLLERPWPGGTTGELLARMEQDASLAGNSWWTKADDSGNLGNAATGPGVRLVRLRPDWVELVIDSPSHDPFALDAKVVAVMYKPMNSNPFGTTPITVRRNVVLTMDEVVHYSPLPDPIARFRGMSWLTPILKEIESDTAATKHKKSFFENAAVPNMVVRFDKDTSEDVFDEFVEQFKEKHQGHWNAYRTLFLMGGADVTPLTHNFQQLEFTQTQGKGESRIAAAAGVPSSWLGFSEGMQGSSLNAGNFNAARRRFCDGTIRPLWRMVAASLEVVVNVPDNARLWFDDRDIAFLREDAQDRARIVQTEMNALDSGIKAGFEPDAVVDAVRNQDIGRLIGQHTGLVSVQMQPPVDPDNDLEETRGEAGIMAAMAQTIQTLVSAGFTHESSVIAVDRNDMTLLVKDTSIEPWSPTGAPLRLPGPGADTGRPTTAPPALPGGTPTSTPTARPIPPSGSDTGAAPTGKPPKPKPTTTRPKGGGNG